MSRILFFDIETRKHAIDLRPDDEQAGWDDLRAGLGGISALCIYDTATRWNHIYDDNSTSFLSAVKHLETADVLVGFRSMAFDVPCVEGRLGRSLRLKTHIDIYTEIAQENARRGIKTAKGDLTLDAICRRNLGKGKIEHGSHAKALAAGGRWAELFNYCLDDVHLTYDLFKYICTNDGVHNVARGWLPLTIDPWIKEMMVQE